VGRDDSALVKAQDNLNIVRWGRTQALWVSAGSPPKSLPSELSALPDNTCVAFPSDAVRTLSLPVSPEEVKHLRQALPYMLEESLLEDVAGLHFAHVGLGENLQGIAIVRRETLDAWTASLPDALLDVPWVAEALCLPWQEGTCTLLFEEGQVLARWSPIDGARIEAALLPALLERLPNQTATVVVYGEHEDMAMAAIPDTWRARCQWRQGGFAEALLVAEPTPSGPDLRQGAYAPKLPLTRWWQQWQRVAVALGVALILKTGVSVADYQTLKAQDLHLRQAMQVSYRQVNPQGAVVDIEKQLNRQLAEFGAGTNQRAFTPMLTQLLEAVATVEGILLTSVNYSGGNALRVNLTAPDFPSVERVQEALRTGTFSVELENSSARREGVVARLSVEVKR